MVTRPALDYLIQGFETANGSGIVDGVNQCFLLVCCLKELEMGTHRLPAPTAFTVHSAICFY